MLPHEGGALANLGDGRVAEGVEKIVFGEDPLLLGGLFAAIVVPGYKGPGSLREP
jgi:hypothetical protein